MIYYNITGVSYTYASMGFLFVNLCVEMADLVIVDTQKGAEQIHFRSL